MRLHEIKERRAALVSEMRGILSAAGSNALTADAQARFDGMKADITNLEGQEARAQFLESEERRMMGGNDGESRDTASLEGRVSVSRILQAQMEGRSLAGAEAEYAQETERRTGRKAEGVFVPLSAFERRVNTTASAGELVPTDHRADQYISPLRNALLARKLGVRVLSGLRGNVTMPKHGTGLSVGWVAEGGNLGDSDMDFDPVTLAPKHAGGKTEMSRQLIQQSSPDCEQLIRDDLAAAIAAAIDSALILGGGANEPAGVLSTVGIQTANLATLNWVNILAMIEKAEIANAGASNWLTHAKAVTKLASTLKSAGIPGYLLENGKMANLPLFSTNQVPQKAGAPATGRVILGDWSQVMLGIWSEVDILVNPYAEPAYSRGGVNVRVMTTCDIALRHPTAFVVADDLAL
jgi:HK97 family phage major capsid protein